MRRVREAAMSEGVGGKEVTVLIVEPRLRNAGDGNDRSANYQQ
jgi:hypothetical protein